MTIYVGDLAYEVTGGELKKLFIQCGGYLIVSPDVQKGFVFEIPNE